MKLRYLILPAMLFFAGCNTDVKLPDIGFSADNGICEKEPKWVVNPPIEKNAIYGVGVAPRNFNGEQAQRKSAIAKAINEIASQMNTTVNSQVMTRASIHNGNGSSSMNSVSFQTVNGQKVSAKIVKSCKNPNNGYFYVLMKAGK
jgi:hypothetical protein